MNRSVPESLLICILVLCLALTPISVRGETEDSGKAQQLIEAPGAVLMEKETGTVIYSRDPDTRRSPASITKIMTLILIFDAIREGTLHLEDSITTSAYARSMGGSQVFLEEGEKQTAETMIKCIVIASGNDASVAMAEHVAGTEQAFVERMNERAKDLGMKNTHFVDCCGLTESQEHYTTPYDIALMSRELISRYPEVLTYSSVWMEDITHVTRKGSSKFTLTNTTVSENVVVKNVNGITYFNNYKDEDVFKGINEITEAKFLEREEPAKPSHGGGGSGGSTKVTINFNLPDGTLYHSAVVARGTALSEFKPADPTPANGYRFDGWYRGTTKVDDTTAFSASSTLIAKFVAIEYTIAIIRK